MAEFKLGRIRFVWKGAWVTGTVYYKDDIIRQGGRTYFCNVGHTSSALFSNCLQTVVLGTALGQLIIFTSKTILLSMAASYIFVTLLTHHQQMVQWNLALQEY